MGDHHFKKGNKLGGRKSVADGGKPGHLQLAGKLLDDAMPDVVRSVIKSAVAGDMAACKMIFDKRLASLKSIEITGTDISKLPRMVIDAQAIDVDVITLDEPASVVGDSDTIPGDNLTIPAEKPDTHPAPPTTNKNDKATS